MASTNPILALYSTIQTNSNGSTISTNYIPYINMAGSKIYTNTLSSLTISSLNTGSSVTSNLNCTSMVNSTITFSTINQIKFTDGYVQNSSALGYGQSYVNKTAYRAVNASLNTGNVYTNDTGRPIYVMVAVKQSSGSTQEITGYVYINSVTVFQKQTNTTYQPDRAVFYVYWDVFFIVPPGSTYQVYCYGTWGVGSVLLVNWYEFS